METLEKFASLVWTEWKLIAEKLVWKEWKLIAEEFVWTDRVETNCRSTCLDRQSGTNCRSTCLGRQSGTNCRRRLVRKSRKALLWKQKFLNLLEEKPLTPSPHSANLLTGQTAKRHQTILVQLSARGISRLYPDFFYI